MWVNSELVSRGGVKVIELYVRTCVLERRIDQKLFCIIVALAWDLSLKIPLNLHVFLSFCAVHAGVHPTIPLSSSHTAICKGIYKTPMRHVEIYFPCPNNDTLRL